MSTPRDVACPYCHARKGHECTNPKTGVKVFTHGARIKAHRPPSAQQWKPSQRPWNAVLIVSAKGEQVKIHDAKGDVIATLNGPSSAANARAIVNAINRETK